MSRSHQTGSLPSGCKPRAENPIRRPAMANQKPQVRQRHTPVTAAQPLSAAVSHQHLLTQRELSRCRLPKELRDRSVEMVRLSIASPSPILTPSAIRILRFSPAQFRSEHKHRNDCTCQRRARSSSSVHICFLQQWQTPPPLLLCRPS